MMLEKSQLKQEDHFYLQFDNEGNTRKVKEVTKNLDPKFSYRQVHDFKQISEPYNGNDFFKDEEYEINLGLEFDNASEIIVRRLNNLYTPSNKPAFFNESNQITRPENPSAVPFCVNELALYPMIHYKSLFLTQDFQKSGKYIAVINNEGRFEVIVVDDYIPISKRTLEPLWGMSYLNPWQLILMKIWAKKVGGYHKIWKTNPFDFIQHFSNSCWKYFNFTRDDGEEFFHRYDPSKLKRAKVVLKTKNDSQVNKIGLNKNQACYELINFFEDRGEDSKQKNYIFTIRCTTKNHWAGTLSFFDERVAKHYRLTQPDMNIERDFFMHLQDFKNIFAAAYITSVRNTNYITGYKVVQIAPNQKHAQHYEFIFPKDGFFDFSIKQFQKNAVDTGKSNVRSSYLPENKRYLKNKYVLVRDNKYNVQGNSNYATNGPSKSNLGGSLNVPGSNTAESQLRNSNIDRSTHGYRYPEPRYTTHEIQYLKGYNKGQAHFVYLQAGRYILRLKSEHVQHEATYSINWVSNNVIDLNEVSLDPRSKQELLEDALVSVMHKVQHFNFQKGKKTEMISVAGTFEELGYGYVAMKASEETTSSTLLTVDPKILAQEGYRLKGKHKNEKEPFTIMVDKYQYAVVIFKINNEFQEKHVWPSHAFKFWRKKEGEVVPMSNTAIKQSQIPSHKSTGPKQPSKVNQSNVSPSRN